MKSKIVFTEFERNVLDDIEKNGGKVYIVGGLVRDSFLFKELDYHDVDVEVYHLTVLQLTNILSKYGKVNEVGKAFGILKINTLPNFDFALPRIEKKVGKGHIGFEVEIHEHMDLYQASLRRDFTINALLYEYSSGKVYDFHHGIDDIKHKCLSMVNEKTFQEDPLRVLRAAQFASRFGYHIDEKLKRYCLTMVEHHMLDDLSDERVYQEYCKLLMASQPSIGLTFLMDIKALPTCIQALKDTMQRQDYHPEGNVFNHTLLVVDLAALVKEKTSNPLGFMWASFLHDLGKPVVTTPEGHAKGHPAAGCKVFDEQLDWLIKDHKLRKYIKTLIFYHMHLMNMTRNHSKDISYYRLLKGIDGILPIEDLILISKCDKMGRLRDGSKDIQAMDAYLNEKMARLGTKALAPVIDGKDLLKLGLKPSIKFKELLDQAYEMQLEGMSKEKILKKIRE